jgi:hypothetical protein
MMSATTADVSVLGSGRENSNQDSGNTEKPSWVASTTTSLTNTTLNTAVSQCQHLGWGKIAGVKVTYK